MSIAAWEVRLPALHANQTTIRNNAARFNVLACGRRWGKTVFGIDRAIRPASKGKRVGWFAPEYRLLEDAWREIKEALGPSARINEQQKIITLNDGGRIEAWAFDRSPNAGRSRRYHRIIIDEAAHCDHLERAWTRSLRPTLTDFKGDAWFLSSPNGPNYFRTLFDRGQRGEPGWRSWRQTSYDNPHLDRSEIDAARQELPHHAFAQEYLAEFLDESHQQLLPTSWVDRCTSEPRANARGGPRSLAIDIAKGTGRDRTVAIVGDDLGVLTIVASNRIDVRGAAQLASELSADYAIAHHRIAFDAGGWAGPDMERYLEALGIYDADAYRGGQKGGPRFANRRARCAWRLRQRLDPDRPRIVRPQRPSQDDDPWASPGQKARPETQPPYHIPRTTEWGDLREELIALRYQYDSTSIELERKEACQTRLGRSPDLADALIMLASTWEDE